MAKVDRSRSAAELEEPPAPFAGMFAVSKNSHASLAGHVLPGVRKRTPQKATSRTSVSADGSGASFPQSGKGDASRCSTP